MCINSFSTIDCPNGYDCPDETSTDSCMVDQNGEAKIHAGCFFPNRPSSNPRRNMIWGTKDCEIFCNDDPTCKGFSIGLVSDISTEEGCLLATNRTDCTRIWDYKQYPKNESLAVVGDLMENSTPSLNDNGFTGCYGKILYLIILQLLNSYIHL